MAVKSPCVDVCSSDGRTGYCVVCLRPRAAAREADAENDGLIPS